MTKNNKRDMATSLTSTIFLVIGTTGVMMYFHILDSYTKDLHEILGLVFVGVVFFHILFNWKSMKSYFNKKIFLSAVTATFIVVLAFTYTAYNEPKGANPKKVIINAVLKSQIEEAVNILGTDMETVEIKLKKANIKFDDEVSIQQIAKNNKTSPFRIVKIILN